MIPNDYNELYFVNCLFVNLKEKLEQNVNTVAEPHLLT